MPLQSRDGTLRPPRERRSKMPTPARIITACHASLMTIPGTVDVPRIGMTRHAGTTTRWPAHGKAGGIPGVLPPGRSLKETLSRAECGTLPLLPGSPESVRMSASLIATGYKMMLLCPSSRPADEVRRVLNGREDFACNVAFEATYDLALAQSLRGAPPHVFPGPGIVTKPDQDDAV